MLDGWHEFYALLGTAAAALVALLFVAMSIGATVLNPARAGATRTFLSPVVFHYTSVLFVSLIVLIPIHTPLSLGISVGIVAAIGLTYSTVILARLIRDDVADLADHFGYGASPEVAYAAALVAAWLLAAQSSIGAAILAGALMLLLVVNIRNAWDLTLAFARRQAELVQQARAPENNSSQPPSP
jgi:hypothetical protein